MEIVLCWSQPDERLDFARVALGSAMRDLGLIPHWREQGGCLPASLQLRVEGLFAAKLHGSAGLTTALRSCLSRESRRRSVAGARILFLAAVYIPLTKCTLCWTVWLAVIGLVGTTWSPSSLYASDALLATASVVASLTPFRLFLRARRFVPAAALLLGTAAVLKSRFGANTRFVADAGFTHIRNRPILQD